MRTARRPPAPVANTTRQFIEAEIALGLTFVRLAHTEYRYGETALGRTVKAKAAQASAEAEYRLNQAEARGVTMRDLRARLGQLLAALARFDEDERKAA